jgi:hypothetical protein
MRKGDWKRLAESLRRGARPVLVSVGRLAGVEKAHEERLGKSREGLADGPHTEVSERGKTGG